MSSPRLFPRLAALTALCSSACGPTPPPPRPPAPTSSAKPPVPTASATASLPPEPPSVPAKQIALDGEGGCAVLEDGGVSCWGGLYDVSPRRLPKVTDAVSVALGQEIAVVRKDGSVLTFADREARAESRTLSVQGIRQISWDLSSACALLESGKVSCWPAGGIHDRKTGAEQKAMEVPSLSDAVSVGASGEHACARRKTGQVVCWQLAKTGPQKPKVVAGIANANDIYVGPHLSCVREASRKVKCFSLDNFSNFSLTEVGESDVLGANQQKNLAFRVCFAGASGGIRCQHPAGFSNWSIPDSLPSEPVTGSQGLSVKQLVMTDVAECILDDKGIVRCWGGNAHGVLGLPYSIHVGRPEAVPGLPAMRSVEAGRHFTCGLAVAGDVYCWGGAIKLDEKAKESPAPTIEKVSGLAGVDRLVVNNDYGCAFSRSGEASCFYGTPQGANESQAPRLPIRVPALDGLKEASLPQLGVGNASAAIGKSGELLVGHSAAFMALTDFKLTPVKGISQVRRVTTTWGDEVVVQDDKGRVFSVDLADRKIGALTPRSDLDDALALTHDLALLPGGKVRALGSGGNPRVFPVASSPLVSIVAGETACGSTASGSFVCLTSEGTPITIFEKPKHVAGSSEDGHQCAVDEAGVLRCRGTNDWNQCGVKKGLFFSDEPIEVHLH